MGGRGPAPKPAKLKLLNGRCAGRDSSGNKVNEGPSFRRAPLGPPPDDLGERGRAEWLLVAAELDRLEISKPLDRAALTAYCLSVERMLDAQDDVRENGLVLVGARGGAIKNPAVTVVEEASRAVRMWAQEFGFTPSAEQRIAAQAVDPDDGDNPFADGGDRVTG